MLRAVISETQYADFYIALKTCPESRGPAGSQHCALRLLTLLIPYLGNKLQDKGSHAIHADSPPHVYSTGSHLSCTLLYPDSLLFENEGDSMNQFACQKGG